MAMIHSFHEWRLSPFEAKRVDISAIGDDLNHFILSAFTHRLKNFLSSLERILSVHDSGKTLVDS